VESKPLDPTAAEASAALVDAEAARALLARDIATPRWFFTSISVAVAVQIATTAVGLGAGVPWVMAAGLAVFAAVAGLQLARFRQLNGVWLGGLASRVVLGTGIPASSSYAIALGAAIWAAFDARWWFVALWAIAGGSAYALSGRRWLRAYRALPAVHGRGESAVWLIPVGVAAFAGLAFLLMNG
jgi:hypothetical protein